MKKKFKCPVCEREVDEHPALSRVDNRTEICSKCGVDEAMRDFRVYGSDYMDDEDST